MVHQITSEEEFNEIIKSNEIVIVDFFATWCGPCKMIAPKFENFSSTYTKAKFIKVDVDEVPAVAEKVGVTAMPTFVVFKGGEEAERIVGANPSKLEDGIKKFAA
ncbi:Cytoplasmic thioredoxin isoenzyme 2 [Gaertneriomyces sp. JEL0708]|nr:Cytoplasmic thioredoxin isoenzyme 2 [Gaertneriomyces sp. JEL0708]